MARPVARQTFHLHQTSFKNFNLTDAEASKTLKKIPESIQELFLCKIGQTIIMNSLLSESCEALRRHFKDQAFDLTLAVNEEDLASLLMRAINQSDVIRGKQLIEEIEDSLRQEQISDIEDMGIYHQLLDQLVDVVETPEFTKIVLSSASAMIREVASHAMNGFDVDGKIPLVKVIPLINKICQPDQHSGQGFSDFMSTALTFETITAFADSVFDTFSL